MMFRCSRCAAEVHDNAKECPNCGAVFRATTPDFVKNAFSALTGNRSLDEIKEDWIYEVRRGIVGGVQKTFGVDGEGNDTFKEKQLKDTSNNNLKNNDADFEVIDAEFEVIEEVDYEVVEEDGTLKKKPKGNTMNDLPKDVQEALRKRAGLDSDD